MVAHLDVHGDAVAVVVNAAGAHCQNFAFLRLFLGGIGNVQAGSGLLFAVNLTDDNTIFEGLNGDSHFSTPFLLITINVIPSLPSRGSGLGSHVCLPTQSRARLAL